MDLSLGATAFWWGIVSAVSLLIGAAMGLWLRPKKKINAVFMAFGAGALLFALTIELFGHVPHHVEEFGLGSLYAAVIGAILGGVIFDFLNSMLNNQGAFLRKLSTARQHIRELKISRNKKLIEELSKIEVFKYLPPKKMAVLINRSKKGEFKAGETLFSQGDEAKEMYFIFKGEVDIVFHSELGKPGELIACLKEGDTLGELGVMGGFPRTADAIAKTNVHAYRIGTEDIQEVMETCPQFKSALKALGEERMDLLKHKRHEMNVPWKEEALSHMEDSTTSVSAEEIHAEGKGAIGGAAVAIWLGILIDGVPESLVIGMMVGSPSGVSVAFVAGVFMANFPEAMSSAVGMRQQGMKLFTIYMMWGTIVVLTGIGAFLGATLFPHDPSGALFYLILGIEGLAAGAMLTMIAETMLPEAFEQGGSVVGLATLGGFLCSLAIKVI